MRLVCFRPVVLHGGAIIIGGRWRVVRACYRDRHGRRFGVAGGGGDSVLVGVGQRLALREPVCFRYVFDGAVLVYRNLAVLSLRHIRHLRAGEVGEFVVREDVGVDGGVFCDAVAVVDGVNDGADGDVDLAFVCAPCLVGDGDGDLVAAVVIGVWLVGYFPVDYLHGTVLRGGSRDGEL